MTLREALHHEATSIREWMAFMKNRINELFNQKA
jgi:hypothetical protein